MELMKVVDETQMLLTLDERRTLAKSVKRDLNRYGIREFDDNALKKLRAIAHWGHRAASLRQPDRRWTREYDEEKMHRYEQKIKRRERMNMNSAAGVA